VQECAFVLPAALSRGIVRRNLASDPQSVYERLTARAAAQLGGTEALAERLGIPHSKVMACLEGRETPDMPLVLRMLEIALDG
jgi:hypothetical protein